MDWLTACKEFGVIGGLLLLIMGAVIGMCIKGWMWILQQFKVELDGNRKERTEYLETLGRMREGIEDHNCRSKEFMNCVAKEHQEMILALGRINGFKEY